MDKCVENNWEGNRVPQGEKKLSLSHWYPGSGVVLDCTLTYFDYQSCFVCAAWRPKKVSTHFHLMLILFRSSGLCVQSPSIIPVPGYPLCLVPHYDH